MCHSSWLNCIYGDNSVLFEEKKAHTMSTPRHSGHSFHLSHAHRHHLPSALCIFPRSGLQFHLLIHVSTLRLWLRLLVDRKN